MASPSDLERLRQLELEIAQQTPSALSGASLSNADPQVTPQAKEPPPQLWQKLGRWGRPLGIGLVILLCVAGVALALGLLRRLLGLLLVVGLGLVLFRWVVAPRLGLIKPAPPKTTSSAEDTWDW
ncbi:MAG: hypothetical protein NW237_05530 [Cyanobacteriota bacterium]|nr:hypothetical protein [Cyanobacteriota bacterium]